MLAAGFGTRMRPFTDNVPKPLLTVDNEEILARALHHGGRLASRSIVNAHYLAPQIEEFVAPLDVEVSREPGVLGTAGAVGRIRDWLGDDDLLILNGDTWIGEIGHSFVQDWDRERPRLLVQDTGREADFGTSRFIGASLLPNGAARRLEERESGLYEEVWRSAPSLDLVATNTPAFDCGTPEEFLAANLSVSGKPAVIHPTARPGGPVIRSVLLREASTEPGSTCIGEIRDGHGHRYVSRALQQGPVRPPVP